MITYIKVRHDGERFWTVKVDEDDNFIYAIVKNKLVCTEKFDYGDIIRINKETFEVSYDDNFTNAGSSKKEEIIML